MVRKAREESKTGYYHVIMRGNNRNFIFKNDLDKELFKQILLHQEEENLIQIAAWCIMDNHVHIVLESELKNLTLAMKKINTKYAMNYNKKYGSSGHVFQDRYMSQVIQSDEYMMCVIRYVHLNPVKAKLVKEPMQYKWSSYREYVLNKKNSDIAKLVYSYFYMDVDMFKRFHMEEDDQEYMEIKEDQEIYRYEKAQRIIDKYCSKYSLFTAKDIISNHIILNDMIVELKEKSGLSLRKICSLLEIPYSTVQSKQRKL